MKKSPQKVSLLITWAIGWYLLTTIILMIIFGIS
ncbi:MAG: hypothetical protein A4E59_01849 [Syntrophorhabdus sp. PtaB.Bin027]|nr:MAG: hypothetical protein A4E59_01849 [Syntrophorhabdus sp. PtaB.Bin027]OQB75964.1 MAG: hypothetical protein BWX92_02253 [Deltaproteobacteria bacterium ADurb.Bin135]